GRDVRPGDNLDCDFRTMTPGYLDILRVPLIDGRTLGATDGATAPPVALVSANAARRLWPDGSPIGKRFRWDGPADNPWITVVGVVGDVRDRTDDREARAVYLPMDQLPNVYMYFAMRTTGDPAATVRAAEQAVFAIDPTQPVTQVRT